MMKKCLSVLILLALLVPSIFCAESADWTTAPIITTAYELSSGKLYLEWTGQAPVYQVYMDGASVASTIVNNAVIPVEKGTHMLCVYPINEAAASADTKIDVKISVINLGLDLAALGLDSKELTPGTPSVPLNIDYTPSPVFNAVPDDLTATTDFENRVLLSFIDRYNANEYLITIKAGKDINYVHFNATSPEAAPFISKTNSMVTLTLDQTFLQSQGCMVPEFDNKYTFSVQLRKYATNLLTHENVQTVIHESKESKGFAYTPIAAWKTAPIITYASQTADGQATLYWTHNDNSLGCKYQVLKINKTLGVRRGTESLGVTLDKSIIVNDLMNGSYSLAVVPCLNDETGAESTEAMIEIQNDWVVAPALTCSTVTSNQVKLTWTAAEGIESYYLTVYKGDNESLLRYVNLDFGKYAEVTIPCTSENMEYLFSYDYEIDPDLGEKFKFEIYGIRHTADNKEQKTAVSSQTVILK